MVDNTFATPVLQSPIKFGAGPQDRNTSDVPFDITDTDRIANFVRVVGATQPETGAANLRQVQTLAKALAEWAANGAGLRRAEHQVP